MLAQAAARLLARRLLHATCEARDPTSNVAIAHEPELNDLRANGEYCTSDARGLPVTNAGGWDLVDEGGSKQVEKLGYVSHLAGQRLTLNISAMAPDVQCGYMQGTLSFLTGWATNHGAFEVSCSGACECHRYKGVWAASSDPFPRVQTFSPGLGATVSASTRFEVRSQVRVLRGCGNGLDGTPVLDGLLLT